MRTRNTLAAALAVLLLATGLAACEQKGPDPTPESIAAETGPFAVDTATVAAGNGFGGGTIYYPTDTGQGTYGALVVTPGFLMPQSTMSWYGPRIASQGFVVMTIDTISTDDLPAARATEMLAALDWLTSSSVAASRIDPARTAVAGWSMGGGGTLEATGLRPTLRAAIALAPWDNGVTFSGDTVPTLVVACQSDTIAPIAQHAVPFYGSIPSTTPKEYVEIAGGDHFCVSTLDTDTAVRAAIAGQVISWLKRFVDDDGRYTQFLCPTPAVSPVLSATQSSCPFA